ncbi:MAG: NfeD family protein [Candidatus Micrarchaeota archaeon]
MVDFAIGKVFIVVGTLMLAGELAIPGFFMGGVGVAFIVAGALMELGINSPEWIATASILAGLFSILFFYFVGRWLTGHVKVATGTESIVGARGKVIESLDEGKCVVKIKGEDWSAECEGRLKKGEKVEVTGHEGVHLTVKKAED